MAKFEHFEIIADYEVPLLHLLARLPSGRGRTAEVCDRFLEEYGHLIPRDDLNTFRGREPTWRNNVRWCHRYLKQRGFMAESPRGVWQINETARRWLRENPTATRITDVPKDASPVARKRSSPRRTSRRSRKTPVQGITLKMLESTRRTMPPNQFREVWGTLYDQLLAEERAKAVTEITQTELGHRTRRWLDDVHAFLNGKNASAPAAETLCDWVHFCYALELYREATTLFTHIDESELELGAYRRVKRIVAVCRMQATKTEE